MSETFIINKLKNNYNICFLCGTLYNRNSDKRKHLKDFLEDNFNVQAVILEEKFSFDEKKEEMLHYNDAFLNNLYDVEILTSLFSNFIIVVHESLSTAAELGVFSSIEGNRDKVLTLTPHPDQVDEKYITGFLRLAFYNWKENLMEYQYFHPFTKENMVSSRKKNIHTFFADDQVDNYTKKVINKFIDKKITNEIDMKPTRSKFNLNYNSFNFTVNDETKEVNYYVPHNIFLIHISSILNSYAEEIQTINGIFEIINFVKSKYEVLIKNTINYVCPDANEQYKFIFNSEYIKREALNKTVAYCLFVLHAIDLIELPRKVGESIVFRKSNDLYKENKIYKTVVFKETTMMDILGDNHE